MSERKYLIIDGNSLGHWANNGAKLSVGEMPVQAIYNTLRKLRQVMALYSTHTPIFTWDGASWRNMMFKDYKAIRDKADTPAEIKLLAKKAEYKAQVPHIKKALGFLGIAQVWALNMEADDLAAILCDRYAGSRIVMLTNDKDWLQMVSPTTVWRNMDGEVITATNFEEKTGVKTVRQFIEVKAIAGDQGDSIPGVGGVGQKGAIQFISIYGSFNDFLNMVTLEKTILLKGLPKKIRALVEDEVKAITFSRNLDLVDLRTPQRPAPINLTVTPGEPDAEKFRRLCDILLFKSITQELAEWLRVFPHFNDITQGA